MTSEHREPRRGARIAASFWIGIEGIDQRPKVRQGNLSATGMYFETHETVGPAGSVQFLHIASQDRNVVVQVLARIIRVSTMDDVTVGSYVGLALEFMPASAEGRHNLERLVRHVVELGLRQDEIVDHRFNVDVEGVDPTDRTTLQHLSVQKLVLETDWRAKVGDQLQFQINGSTAPQARFPLDGQVTSVKPLVEGYRVEIRVTGLGSKRGETIEQEVQTFTDLIAQPIDDFEMPARDHLSGLLARIKLPTLLGLLEMETMSGELSLTCHAAPEIVLYLSKGRVIDGESAGNRSPVRELLSTVMKWDDGEFRFIAEASDREDVVGSSTTSLILDLAREEDESKDMDMVSPDTYDGEFF